MNNDWRPENNQGSIDGTPRSGDLLREYRQNQQQFPAFPPLLQNQYSPIPPNQYSPVSPPNQHSPISPYYSFEQGQQGPQGQQGWSSNAMQMVRRWSGKMVAQRYGQPEPPMVLRRPQQPLPTTPLPQRPKRWKRSRTTRIARQMRHRRCRWQSNRPNGGRIGIGILIAFMLLLVTIASSTSAYAYGYYQSQLPRLQGLANQHINQTTRIYDRNGILLGDLFDPKGDGRRTPIEYKDVPQIMRDAMIAAEDHTFWTNSGVDPQGILRAATNYAQANAVQGGGSTITQQLIKNMTQDNQVTLNRKLPEAALAIGLTQQYPKWKIMEMYFNISPFGTLDLGVEAAAQEYFHLARTCDTRFKCTPGIARLEYNQNGKVDSVLGLARASLLAGMPQSPVTYDPTNGKESLQRALMRQDEVLHEMLGMGMSVDGHPITTAMIQQAEDLTAHHMKFTRYSQHIRSPHFFEWVKQQLAIVMGNGDQDAGLTALFTGGFNIRTTLDANLETYVENAINRHLNVSEYQPFPQGHYAILSQDNNVHNSAAVVMNAKTGEILAMDGSANYDAVNDVTIKGQFNSAADAYRSPGSTWKPIVYATAFEMGWYPGMVLPDVKTYFPNGAGTDIANAWVPPDYGGQYVGGNNTIHVATANSRNVPAVKALQFAGIDNVTNTARRFGITALDQDLAMDNKKNGTHYTKLSEDTRLSFALGSMGVPLIQMTGAYQVFANQGVRVPPQGVLDIWDNYGHNLYHYDSTHLRTIQVISPQVAYMMTSILTDENARAAEFGGDHVLSFNDWDPNRQVAAKTGTTDNFVDNWTMGYTPNVVVGVWSGNADNTPLINSVGVTGAAPIWHSIIERASGRPCADIDVQISCGNFNPQAYNFNQGTFVMPAGIHQASLSAADGLKGSGNTDWLLDDEDPTQYGIASWSGSGKR